MNWRKLIAVGTALTAVGAFVPTPVMQKCVAVAANILDTAENEEFEYGDVICWKVKNLVKVEKDDGTVTYEEEEYIRVGNIKDSAKGDIVIPDEIDGLKVKDVYLYNKLAGRTGLTSITFPKYMSSINLASHPDDCVLKVAEGNEFYSVENGFLIDKKHEYYDYSTQSYKYGEYVMYNSEALKGEVTIPEGVLGGWFQFAGNPDITVLNLPSTLKSLDWYFCSNMPSLKAINVAEGNDTYFSYKGALGKYYDVNYDENGNRLETPVKQKRILAVPEGYEGVFSVPDGEALIFTGLSFENVSKMTAVELGKDTVFECGGFQGCKSLETIELNGRVTSISGIEKYRGGHWDSEKQDWVEDDYITSIEVAAGMFVDTKWYQNQPDGVLYCGATIIGYKGDPNCDKLDIKEGTRTIVDKAFNGLDIGEVNVPASVEYIGAYALDCPRLTAVNIDKDNKNYASDNGVVYDKDMKWLKLYPQGKTDESYTVPDGVEIIAANACDGNKFIKHVAIPDSVNCIFGWGEYGGAFKNCTALEEFTVPNGIECFNTGAVYNSSLKALDLSATVAKFSAEFDDCDCDYLIFRNPQCEINGMNNFKTIVGLKGSNAEAFASEHQVPFVLLDDYDKAQATATTTTATTTTQTTTTTTATTAASTSSTAQPSTTSTAASTTAQPTTTTTASTEVVTTTAAATVEIVEGTATVKGVYGGKTETHTCPFTYDYTPADGKDYIASIEFDVEISDKVKVSNKGMRTFTSSSGKKLVYLQFDVDAPVTPTEERIMYTITVTKATDVNGNDITASLPFLTKTEPLFIYATPDATTTEYTTTTEQSTTTTQTTTAQTTTASASTTAPVTTTPEGDNPDKPDMSAFLGNWLVYGAVIKGIPRDVTPDETWQFVFLENHTGRFVGQGRASDLTWAPSADGKKLTVTDSDGKSLDFTCDGTELVCYAAEGKALRLKHGELPNDFGDPNRDNKIDANDASFILVQYAKLSTGGESALTKNEKWAADVNKDGKVDAKDASICLAYYSYLSTGGTDAFDVYLESKK
ncbi:MAG: leucine-rich repeat protein [Ruminococcus sp.]|nr:leucine-rich repeat protein [Ruminococcus sp.]